MLFSSLLFLYQFLPITLFIYYLSKERLQSVVLLFASLVFYAWGGPSYISILIISILINYFSGLAMGSGEAKRRRKTFLVLGIILNLSLLVIFKYTHFFIENINLLTAIFGVPPVLIKKIILPLGISFFTFKGISYLFTIYRRETPVQRNFVDLALYISLFPQLIAGPISRYRDLAPQLSGRTHSFEKFSSGIRRFIMGLAKKVLIATPLSYMANQVFTIPFEHLSAPLAWIGILFFALQIYYDFSGYTDMAIGLGRMLGFEFVENFNFPYISCSFREFWRRWHISLSTWFRDYLFLPLAYHTSRKLPKEKYFGLRTDKLIYLIAITITFLLCGFWHGAAWTFIAWGMIHGFMLILEHLGLGKILSRFYKPFQHAYMIFFLLISWVFFRSETFHEAFVYLSIMFGFGSQSFQWNMLSDYLNTGTVVVFTTAILGSTRFFDKLSEIVMSWTGSSRLFVRAGFMHIMNIGTLVFMFAVLALSTIYLAGETVSSFIYFKF
ncbi:MAG: MBOAT family protein [Bacteroidetes bacterium]|nr:MAG: MBOAT family protein [Bacteroidota bacterium]